MLAHQDHEQFSSRQVAALYDIRNPHQILVWRRNLDQGRLQACETRNEEQPHMKPERRSARTVEHGRGQCGQSPATARGGRVPKKIAGLDPIEEISCADKARLIARVRQHHKLADLLQVADLARSTFY